MAVVSLEMTSYATTENSLMIDVCAIVVHPELSCPVSFPFNVSFSTADGSAGIFIVERELYHVRMYIQWVSIGILYVCARVWMYGKNNHFNILFLLFPVSTHDYGALMSEIVTFESCDTRKCVGIEIFDDTLVELVETFTVTVDSFHERIISDSAVAVVHIESDDCKLIFRYYCSYAKRGNEVLVHSCHKSCILIGQL